MDKFGFKESYTSLKMTGPVWLKTYDFTFQPQGLFLKFTPNIFLILDKVSFLETRESLPDIFGIWLENWKPPKNRK